ncbi:tyrosine-type recombinase/integrase [Bacillus cereus]|uniref:tyrosine-type recombinase/integrase n=1 Tax=Bacillus cereus TaxID=1396 RepID=UPI000BF33CF5|nr:tyrosine-type recombinase/integrase [Bacillus cereus]PFO78867.1 recombinase XerD [Bacillus cereus]
MKSPQIEEKIYQIFDYVKKEKINFDEDKPDKKLSDSTLKTYQDTVLTYNRWLEDKYNISIDKAKPKHAYEYLQIKIDAYKSGEGSAFTVKKFPHALHAIFACSKDSGAFDYVVKAGDKRQMLEMAREQGVFRKAAESHSLKANHEDWLKVQNTLATQKTHYKDYILNVHEAQHQLGLRVHEAVKMQKKDIDFKNGILTVKGKGGLVRKVPIHDKDYLKKLEGLCKGKKNGADVFRVQNKKGNPPSKAYKQQVVQEAIKKAAIDSGVNRDGKTYTTHSARKAYAQERVNELKKMSEKDMEKYFEKVCKKNAAVRNGKKRLLTNIRKKFKNKKRAKLRELTKKEMILFLVSCEIGHFRLDVMRYYCEY